MLSILIAAAVSATCPMESVAGAPGENHVLFHGLSRDGRMLAIGWDKGAGAATQRGAYLLDLRTRKRTELPHLNNAPSFSPDGRFLVSANYPGDRALKTEVVELDRRSGSIRSFASAPSLEWLGSYSGNGEWVLFNSTRTGGSDLYRVRRSDGTVEQLTTDPRYEAHGQFFDNGRKLIFHRQTEGDNYDIVIRDLRNGSEQTVGATPLEEAYPAMSPDGRWIAFSAVAGAGAQPNLFVMRADGSRRRRLTEGATKDAYATWAPDGGSIYFVRFDDDGSKIYRIAVRNGACRGKRI